MFLAHRPSPRLIDGFLAAQRGAPFSYTEVGATRDRPPARYRLDRHRICLGRGERDFAAAASCLRRWRAFELGWVTLWPPDAAVEPGTAVAVLVCIGGLWSLNACRIVYVDDEPGWRCGFAYGTLTAHAESGEERFSVERSRTDDSVWYEILAFSRPSDWLAWAGYPLTRALQRRFVRGSMQAMARCTAQISS
jgi:uncharacterized protein (UPF0548 family)